MAKTVLERAKQAFYRKRYNDVITLLETNVIQYRDSFPFYFYLGLACLYSGDVGGATSYFQRARQIKLRDPDHRFLRDPFRNDKGTFCRRIIGVADVDRDLLFFTTYHRVKMEHVKSLG